MQTPVDTLFEQAQPDTTKIFAAPFFGFGQNFKKGTAF